MAATSTPSNTTATTSESVPAVIPASHHRLSSGFTFWYLKKKGGAAYEQSIKKLVTVHTVCVMLSSHLLISVLVCNAFG
jgi:hypothetical protein